MNMKHTAFPAYNASIQEAHAEHTHTLTLKRLTTLSYSPPRAGRSRKMEKKINYIIREVPPEQTDFSLYFEDDGLTEAGGDYCYNLFIVAQSRRSSGFNGEEYQNIQNEIENLLEMYVDIVNKSNYAQYSRPIIYYKYCLFIRR